MINVQHCCICTFNDHTLVLFQPIMNVFSNIAYSNIWRRWPRSSIHTTIRLGISATPNTRTRIAAAAAWLQTRGVRKFVLLSHSMGSRMSLAYWKTTKNAPYAAWICLGIPSAFSGLGSMRAPILDVHGEFDLPPVLAQATGRARTIESIPGSREVVIAGADHFYNGRETQLADAIVAFLEAQGMQAR